MKTQERLEQACSAMYHIDLRIKALRKRLNNIKQQAVTDFGPGRVIDTLVVEKFKHDPDWRH